MGGCEQARRHVDECRILRECARNRAAAGDDLEIRKAAFHGHGFCRDVVALTIAPNLGRQGPQFTLGFLETCDVYRKRILDADRLRRSGASTSRRPKFL